MRAGITISARVKRLYLKAKRNNKNPQNKQITMKLLEINKIMAFH
jgi:hypothetical protein